MKQTWCIQLGLCLAAAVLWAGEQPVRIEGRAILEGTPPPEIPVDLTPYPLVQPVAPPGLTTRHYVVSPDGGLANVLVYVARGLEGRHFPVSTNMPLLDQHNAGFHPYVMGVQVGQAFRIRNSEPYFETVKATPKINQPFTLYQPVTGMESVCRFTKPEVFVKIRCEMHPWEFAHIGVIPHPFFAVTDTNGFFRLPEGLPPGRYTLEAVHPKAGTNRVEVSVAPGETARVTFRFKPHKKPPRR
ncbi:MAG: carboxypeptidase regulatory-like domain-containing protein [Verrucomicrobia bacterium]|nr:MAG: carboxypeptidase regulatory-like domain-containing protein [Verrucomicrobiota bacterium]